MRAFQYYQHYLYSIPATDTDRLLGFLRAVEASKLLLWVEERVVLERMAQERIAEGLRLKAQLVNSKESC